MNQDPYREAIPFGQPGMEREDRAGIYARASKDESGDELSVTRQLEDGRSCARVRRAPVTDEYVDNNITASGKRKRPDFERLLKDIRAGRINIIISTEISRITRGAPGDEIRLFELGMERGLRLWLTRGQDLDLSTATGRLMASWTISVARHEIEQKGERQKRANLQKARQGKWVGGRRPFGYEDDGVTIRPDEAQAIRDAYDSVLAGASLGMIAETWNELGFTAQEGWKGERRGEPTPWERTAVRFVLTNPRYAGFRAYVPADTVDKTNRVRARIAGIAGRAEWPALVTEDVWRAALNILLDPDRYTGTRSTIALLTGIAKCQCGALVHGGRTPGGVRNYRCKGRPSCFARQAEPVDEYVARQVQWWLAAKGAAALFGSALDGPDVAGLLREAQVVRTRLEQLVSEFADSDDMTPAEYRALRGRLRERLAGVEARLASAGRGNVLSPFVSAVGMSEDPRECIDAVTTVWNRLDRLRQRSVLSSIVEVTLTPVGRGVRGFNSDTVKIDWVS